MHSFHCPNDFSSEIDTFQYKKNLKAYFDGVCLAADRIDWIIKFLHLKKLSTVLFKKTFFVPRSASFNTISSILCF